MQGFDAFSWLNVDEQSIVHVDFLQGLHMVTSGGNNGMQISVLWGKGGYL